jgi:septum site-determining protein MinC
VNFKGVNDGLILQINENSNFELITNELQEKAKMHSSLIKNANLLGIIGKKLTYSEKAVLENILKEIFKINVLSLEIFSYNDNIVTNENKNKSENKSKSDTIFIQHTLRSGNEIISEGNIVVLGDVNPGAILKAKGNIIVMGKLRGIAHAGIKGDNNAFILANLLVPTQIRISNIISRSPDNNNFFGELVPEKAYINNDRIEIVKI